MDRINQLQQHHAMPLPPVRKTETKNESTNFKDILAEIHHPKVSKHAKERLNERNITISETQWQAISEKMTEAKHKGVTDSLVVTDNAALLVSTKNNTVVTAMNKEEATSKIFTNINGTILINE
ncbi:flagellar operon protein [Virgibacillus subterraneus]|uniref:Flagellar operon protein n=2 Tax=Virgibacillus TaxID=84406 RepID=A0A1H1C8U6_9BACI|nr:MULTISPECIES: TIGR02530 family flagellar biosynthesis protein [Virgibacillus]SDQ60568.1 flagellar operon protein [Virgibacillus salinus]SEQ58156.1 flagellar operon protein [Virgibacillus subterraneus]